MKAYRIESGVIEIGPGARIGMMPEQAAPRAHKLVAVSGQDGVYEATGMVQFKAGELIGLDDPSVVGKAQAERIVEASDDDMRAQGDAARVKAEALAKAKNDAQAKARAIDVAPKRGPARA